MTTEARRRHPKRWFTLLAVLIVLPAGAGYAYAKLDANIAGQDVDAALGTDRPAGADSAGAPENILLLGSDSRAGADAAYGQDTGSRSDTAMVVHLSADRRRATVVSIPRDTMVRIPSCPSGGGRPAAVGLAVYNTALNTGGLACAVKATETLTGLRMNHVIQIDGRVGAAAVLRP
jgi:anionic cell wall polymer biosynthesis LytR-Cps2A-Psr (LCP) family protein